ncbi:MAG: universal stress protein [Candidatus Sulfotelmatobacter sp.]|jgi:universal stress protein A
MTTIFRKILCPVAFSDNSMAALDQAAKLARKSDALLYLMHVQFVPMGNLAELAEEVTLSTQPGKLQLERIARKHLARVRHKLLVQFGKPAELIEKAAQDLNVDLIVMATHERTGINRLLLGSIAEHVLRTSKRPVLSFGPGTAIGALKTILCLVGFDPDSIAALKFGWRLAQEYRAAVSLLRIVPVPFEPSEVPVEPSTPEWEQNARAQLVKVAAENLGAKAKYKPVVRRGDPASAILEVEKELRPDLIVMASHEQSGLSHLIFGSVAERTVRESIVPVLTVRG